jgi:hypothetical protein
MSRSPEEFSPEEFANKGQRPERGNETTEEEAEVAPITERFLETLYSSPVFWKTLKDTWQKVEEFHGRELGFSIWKDIRSDHIWLSEPHGGEDEHEVATTGQFDEMQQQLWSSFPERDFCVLGRLHFHTRVGEDPLIIPSGADGDLGAGADLRSRNEDTGYEIPPIEMIVARTTAGELKILVYQEPLEYVPEKLDSIWKELDESLDYSTIKDQQEVLGILRHYQYRTEVIKGVKDAFTDEQLKNLAAFAFVPRRMQEDNDDLGA